MFSQNLFSQVVYVVFLTNKVNQVTLGKPSHDLIFFPLEKKLAIFEYFFYVQEKFDLTCSVVRVNHLVIFLFSNMPPLSLTGIKHT